MSYYDEVKRVNLFVDEIIDDVKEGREVSIKLLLFEAGKIFSVGNKVILKRIKLNQELDSRIVIEGDTLKYKEITEKTEGEDQEE